MSDATEPHPFYKMIDGMDASPRHKADLRFAVGYAEFEADLAFADRDPADDEVLARCLPTLTPRGCAAVHAIVKKSRRSRTQNDDA